MDGLQWLLVIRMLLLIAGIESNPGPKIGRSKLTNRTSKSSRQKKYNKEKKQSQDCKLSEDGTDTSKTNREHTFVECAPVNTEMKEDEGFANILDTSAKKRKQYENDDTVIERKKTK